MSSGRGGCMLTIYIQKVLETAEGESGVKGGGILTIYIQKSLEEVSVLRDVTRTFLPRLF